MRSRLNQVLRYRRLNHRRQRDSKNRAADDNASLRQAVALDPSNVTTLNNLALTGSRNLRPYTEAVQLLEAAAQADPSNKDVVDNLYLHASAHVQGHGFDRLDLVLYLPALISGLLMAAILLGYVQVPTFVTAACIGVFTVLIVIYSVLDIVRNRRRFLALRASTRSLYRRRFHWDLFVQTGFFLITFALPALVVYIIEDALDAPGWTELLVVGAMVVAWWFVARRLWYERVRGLVASKR